MTNSNGLGKVQAALAVVVVVTFFATLGWVLYASQSDHTLRDLRLQLITALQVAFGGIIGYFFAASARNQQTDILLASSTPTPIDPVTVTTTSVPKEQEP